ncbi:MFS transporter [Blastococcus sp. SYSU DS0541]
MVAVSALALAITAPGQTAAISAFIDPMTRDLGISRSAISTAYLIGTLAGAAAMPVVGRALDRYGTRLTMAAIGAVFGGVLLALSEVSTVVGLTAGFVGVRMAGQGALGLVATTAVAVWFSRRRGLAVGVVSAVGAAGISLAPVGLEALISATDWRTAWAIEGVAVWAIVIPLALFGVRNSPADLGQRPDGRTPEGAPPPAAGPVGATLGEAVRTPFFWVILGGVAVSGMLGTAVAFHQIDLLGEQGLSSGEAAANFLPQTAASLLATLVVGALVDRISPRWLTAGSMLALTGGLTWGTAVDPGWSAIGFGLVLGGSAGAIRTLEAGAFPRYFGTTHLGTIRGVVASVSVGSTAFGPVGFALVHDATGGYTAALLASAVLPLLVAVAGLLLPVPSPLSGDPSSDSGPRDDVPMPEAMLPPGPAGPRPLPGRPGPIVTNGSPFNPDVRDEFPADWPRHRRRGHLR